MEYSVKLLNFLKDNVTSYELQFFTVTDVAKSIIDFNLYLKGNSDSINYGLILSSLFTPIELFKNIQFSQWTFLKVRSYYSDITEQKLNEILDNEKLLFRHLKEYFEIIQIRTTRVVNSISSIKINPYSKSELETCDKIHLTLHDFQIRVKDRMSNLLIHNGKERVLVQMPTGSGKTRTAIEFLIDHVRANAASLNEHNIYLWFTNSVELSEQAFNTFVELWKFRGDRTVGAHKLHGSAKSELLFDQLCDENISIVFIGFQKFQALFNSSNYSDSRLLQLLREDNVISVVDEAHISLATTYDRAIEYVSSFNRSKLIGLTATPGRNSLMLGGAGNVQLAQKFHFNLVELSFKESLDRSPIENLQELGYLAKVDFNEIENYSRLAANSPIELLAFDLERNKKILQVIEDRYDESKSVLVFSASTEHSVILKACLDALSIPSEIIDSHSDIDSRSHYISDFKSGKLRVLINFGVLSTGFDAPILNCLVIARPISSLVLFSQIMGRALRGPKNGGNEKNEVVIVKDKMINYPNADFLYSYWSSFWN
jgi:superfamily II DNA or RNA helicase